MVEYKVLILGDSHIHDRADEIPGEFMDIFASGSYEIVIHTGDLVDPDVLSLVKKLGRRQYVVRGNMDYLDLPKQAVFEVGGVKIGVVHGDQVRPRGNIEALTRIAKTINVNVLVSGHTHAPFITEHEGVIHVNPGSVTGVWGGGGGSMRPSFIEMTVMDNKINVELYELVNNRVLKTRSREFAVNA
ncbi:MAG: YfcE family phosphodiesterase [Vulcanisaeta sp.]|nr:YfcE family phosphodiesterase [Vulcanisaeta sp.]MCG2886728.1 YfcE family phosphodiesterase [Vulcanisaeta sp.]